MYSYTSILKALLPYCVLFFLLTGCKAGESREAEAPVEQQPVAGSEEWLNNLIQQLRQEKTTNPPASIYRYSYKGNVVYYLLGRCCDRPSTLYDLEGNVICEPDGGITGKGDGRCDGFFTERTEETLIWEDKRE